MVEHIEVYEAVVPEGVEPVNQDGEVGVSSASLPKNCCAGWRPMPSRSRPG